MSFGLHPNGKFGLVAIESVYATLPASEFQLQDGTWVLPKIPVSNLGIWNEWLGSLAIEELRKANVVILQQEPSDNPEILDGVHKRFYDALSRLFYFLQLSGVIEYSGGSGWDGTQRDKVETGLSQRWLAFIAANREDLLRGRKFRVGDAELKPDLFPIGAHIYHEGKPWPVRDASPR